MSKYFNSSTLGPIWDNQDKPLYGCVWFLDYSTSQPKAIYSVDNVALSNPQFTNANGTLPNQIVLSDGDYKVQEYSYVGDSNPADDWDDEDLRSSNFSLQRTYLQGGTSSSTKLSNIVTVDTIAKLRERTEENVLVLGYYVKGDCESRIYSLTTKSLQDDGGSVILNNSQSYYVLERKDTINSRYFGIIGNGSTDYYAQMSNLAQYCYSNKIKTCYFDTQIICKSGSLNFGDTYLHFTNAFSSDSAFTIYCYDTNLVSEDNWNINWIISKGTSYSDLVHENLGTINTLLINSKVNTYLNGKTLVILDDGFIYDCAINNCKIIDNEHVAFIHALSKSINMSELKTSWMYDSVNNIKNWSIYRYYLNKIDGYYIYSSDAKTITVKTSIPDNSIGSNISIEGKDYVNPNWFHAVSELVANTKMDLDGRSFDFDNIEIASGTIVRNGTANNIALSDGGSFVFNDLVASINYTNNYKFQTLEIKNATLAITSTSTDNLFFNTIQGFDSTLSCTNNISCFVLNVENTNVSSVLSGKTYLNNCSLTSLEMSGYYSSDGTISANVIGSVITSLTIKGYLDYNDGESSSSYGSLFDLLITNNKIGSLTNEGVFYSYSTVGFSSYVANTNKAIIKDNLGINVSTSKSILCYPNTSGTGTGYDLVGSDLFIINGDDWIYGGYSLANNHRISSKIIKAVGFEAKEHPMPFSGRGGDDEEVMFFTSYPNSVSWNRSFINDEINPSI